jgi:peptidoglycan/LPS O-acetylase OafA/YrhL
LIKAEPPSIAATTVVAVHFTPATQADATSTETGYIHLGVKIEQHPRRSPILRNASPEAQARSQMNHPGRLKSLDGLRAIAALGVVAYHFREPTFYYGLLGVELFFVISGFVILMTVEHMYSTREFAIARATRLYPAYWLSVVMAGSILVVTQKTNLSTVLINATMLQAFAERPNIIDPYWTLAYELVFYAVMAVLFRMRQLQVIDRLAVVWLVAMIAIRGAILASGHGASIYNNWWIQLLLMPQFGHLFIAGMMIYRINTGRSSPWTLLALSLAVAYSLFGRPDWAQISPAIYFLANAAFVATVWAASSGQLWALSLKPLVAIGACSYSLYLLHVPVQLLFSALSKELHGQAWFQLTVELPVALSVAVLAYQLVERPAQLCGARMRRSRG